jgi:tRNA (guanosine-2'-O-)-methyltransferase
VKQLDSTGMKRLHREWRRRTAGHVGLVLDGLGTPANVGAIVRTAAAYRVDDLWLAGATPDLDGTGVQRTALGTDRYLEARRMATGADAVADAREDGYLVVAVELTDTAVPLHECALGDDVCLVVGHEDHGVSKAALEACDLVAYLPMLGRVGSLNVATAAAIALYEVRRRAWT